MRIIGDYFINFFSNIGMRYCLIAIKEHHASFCSSSYEEKKEDSETPYSDERPSFPFGLQDKRGRLRIEERGEQHRDE